jgi:hypothetical protein
MSAQHQLMLVAQKTELWLSVEEMMNIAGMTDACRD